MHRRWKERSGTTLRAFIAVVLFIHGMGHFGGVIAALKLVAVKGWNSRSWLLTPILGEKTSRILSIILFLIALIGFIGSPLDLLGRVIPHDWWRTLALVSSVISIVTIVLFWNAFVALFPSKVGALGIPAGAGALIVPFSQDQGRGSHLVQPPKGSSTEPYTPTDRPLH